MQLSPLQHRRWATLKDTLKAFRAAENSEQAWLELIFAISLLERFAAEFDRESSLGGIRQVSEGPGLNEDRWHDASAADEQVSSGDPGAPPTAVSLNSE